MYIGVSGIGTDGYELPVLAKEAELTEPAFFEDGKIEGFDCPRASARFLVNVPEPGMYQIAMGYLFFAKA